MKPGIPNKISGNNSVDFQKVFCFTQQANGLARVIESEITVINSEIFDPKIPLQDQNSITFNCIAVWDTGAMRTVITQKVVDILKLGIIGFQKIAGVGSTSDTTEHAVDILLPNKVAVKGVPVLKGILPGNSDVLIGMDIITLGDFVVTNYNGKTALTFRIPSLEFIDFTKQVLPSRNGPCPCGAGKKYKHCHEK